MKSTKKILAMLLSLAMLATLGSVAFASSGEASAEVTNVATELSTWVLDGAEVPEGTDGAVEVVTPNFGRFGYFTGGDDTDYDYRCALYYDVNGLNEEYSVTDVVVGGSYDDSTVNGVTIDSSTSQFTSIIAVGDGTVGSTRVDIEDAVINSLAADSDGSAVSDFTGMGAAVYASEGGVITLKNSEINTDGVAKLGLMIDDYGAILLEDSKIYTHGGTLYEDYLSTANQAVMCAPPWVLGIGGNARSVNVEGQSAVLAVYNSEVTSAAWGILSVDAGSNMTVFALDSVLSLDNSNENYSDDPFITDEPQNGMTENYGTGYCSYGIGNPREWFLGCTINVGTYAVCITGGYATYGSSNGTFDVYPTDKEAAEDEFLGSSVIGLASEPVFSGLEGAGNNTVINSDGFGFMCHGSGGIYVTEGTVVNTDEATFLLKTSGVTVKVDGQSQLNTANGILYQLMDNDDSAVGMNSELGTQVFNTSYSEDAGWPSSLGNVKGAGGTKYDYFQAEDVTLNGNIYNATGYSGTGLALDVTLGADAVLNGAIAATESIHADENYSTAMTAEEALATQKTYFEEWDEYYYIGRVANRVFYNGYNVIDVNLTENAVWNVTGVSVITSLNVADGATVNGEVYEHDGFVVVVPAGEDDPYAGLDATPAYEDGESADFSAIAGGTAPAASDSSFDVTFTLNGVELKKASVGVSVEGNVYQFQISELLDVLGVELSYDETTGIAVISAAGEEADVEEVVEEPAEEAPAEEEPAEEAPVEEAAAEDGDVPATDGTENQGNVLAGSAAPATEEEFDAYVAYCQEYMESYDGVGDGTFDDSARDMALAELSGVSFGDDVNAFPFEMFVSVFGADDYGTFASK